MTWGEFVKEAGLDWEIHPQPVYNSRGKKVKISEKEYAELRQYQMDKQRGRVLTPDGLRFICEAYGWDALKIGQHIIEVLTEMGY